jgi:hypothetical protein
VHSTGSVTVYGGPQQRSRLEEMFEAPRSPRHKKSGRSNSWTDATAEDPAVSPASPSGSGEAAEGGEAAHGEARWGLLDDAGWPTYSRALAAYSDALYNWGLLEQGASVRKHADSRGEEAARSAVSTTCPTCETPLQRAGCPKCRSITIPRPPTPQHVPQAGRPAVLGLPTACAGPRTGLPRVRTRRPPGPPGRLAPRARLLPLGLRLLLPALPLVSQPVINPIHRPRLPEVLIPTRKPRVPAAPTASKKGSAPAAAAPSPPSAATWAPPPALASSPDRHPPSPGPFAPRAGAPRCPGDP